MHVRVKHHASGSNKQACYEMLWKELYERFGQPHVIGDSCEQRLQELSRIGQYDSEASEKMAILMKRCLASLEECSASSTIISIGFIASLAMKLPLKLHRKWVTEALKIQTQSGRQAGFCDFSNLLLQYLGRLIQALTIKEP